MKIHDTDWLSRPAPRFELFDENCRRANESIIPEFEAYVAEYYEDRELNQRILDELKVEKPDWWQDAESAAASFLQAKVGARNWQPVHLLKEDDLLDTIEMRDPPTTIALSDPVMGVIFIREKLALERHARQGVSFIAGLLVHEQIHADVIPGPIVLQRAHDGLLYERFRLGFNSFGDVGDHGVFFEEGRATLLQGWFLRTIDDIQAPPLSTTAPQPELPEHYVQINHPSAEGEPFVSGPEGYAMEMLMWGAERKAIMPAAAFITNLVATGHPEGQGVALRNFARAVERIQPGLYRRLRDLPYGRDAWQEGMLEVYEAVKDL